MHFFKNSISIIAVMCVCGVACAATGRVGVNTVNATTSRRLPSLTSALKAATVASTTTTATSSSSVTTLSDTDCIDDYRDCMKGENACGPDFEECTNRVLFHSHMGECFSTLYQCSSSGIQSLFGTSNLSALSQSTKDSETDEISDYTYPDWGSVMGLDISGAAIRNKLSTADCVKKYKNCLTKDTVCGEDFELCTTNAEFKKQAPMCDSTLSRCQKEGFQQLFGDDIKTKPSLRKLQPEQDGVISQWIDDGATLAASNAVNTCYKVIDTCFTNACAKNPYRCVDGVKLSVLNSAELVGGEDVTLSKTDDTLVDGESTSSDVRKFFRAACENTIGGNKYCFMTFKGTTPTKGALLDEDNQEEIFDEAYSARKSILQSKIQDVVAKFDTEAQNKCINTFRSCAIRSCGGGSGAACYTSVFGANGAKGDASINKGAAYTKVAQGCSGVVNTDANCIYMAAVQNAENYNQKFSDDSAFVTLFPDHTNKAGGEKQTTVVAALNAELSTAYNDAAIAQLRKQCSNVVTNCVKSMCGTEFQNCYRNRNDIVLNVYDTTSKSFDKSMNKTGGVLDFTIVQGLCVSTVKNSDSCEEVVAMAKLKNEEKSDAASSWGDGTVGSAWRNSAYTNYAQEVNKKLNGKNLCDCGDGQEGVCENEEDGVKGCKTPIMIPANLAKENEAIDTVFREVLVEVESEAQAMYKAKLTKEQNICLAQNSVANPDATYSWVKFGSDAKKYFNASTKKAPENYASKGLGDTTVPSNDLYDSFCRVKITLRSDDRDIQNLLSGGSITTENIKESTFLGINAGKNGVKGETYTGNANDAQAYFAAGDAFTCGSWISDSTLNALNAKVAYDARKEAGQGSARDSVIKTWSTIAAGLVGAGGSFALVDSLQNNGKSLGGLLKTNTTTSKVNKGVTPAESDAAKACIAKISTARATLKSVDKNSSSSATEPAAWGQFITQANEALTCARTSKCSVSGVSFSKESNTFGKNSGYVANTAYYDAQRAWADAKPYFIKDGDCSGYIDDYNTVMGWFNKRELSPASSTVKGSAATIIEHCGVMNKGEEGEYDNEVIKKLPVNWDNMVQASSGYSWSNPNIFTTYDENLDKLENACQAIADGVESDEDRKSRRNANIAAAVVGGVATTVLANGIVSSVQKVKYEEAENEAVKEWMDNIGKKIHCYIDGKYAGDFGDIITVEISEE